MSALFPVYPRLPLEVVRAEGVYLHTSDGRKILDLYGAHAVCPLGHAHPAVVEALSQAVRTLDFYSNSLVMPIQERAAKALLGEGTHLSRVHFVNSGTEANESAMHLARKRTGRAQVVTLDTSFHGRTLGSLSVTGLPGYRKKVPLEIPEAWRGTVTYADDEAALAEAITADTAAVMIESIVSLGGVYTAPAGWLERVQARCREVGALFIMDEVQGGVGRLGTWWGHQALGTTAGSLRPDMVTLAKSLGNGFPVAALVTAEEMAEGVAMGELGTTFGGGPMACAMVEAVANTIRRDGLMARVRDLESQTRSRLGDVPGVQVRGMGALLGIQTRLPAAELRNTLLDHDILVGTSGEPNTLRLLLPYVTPASELDRALTIIREVAA